MGVEERKEVTHEMDDVMKGIEQAEAVGAILEMPHMQGWRYISWGRGERAGLILFASGKVGEPNQRWRLVKPDGDVVEENEFRYPPNSFPTPDPMTLDRD